MAIPEPCRENFNTILRAAGHDDLCLVECQAVDTGQPVYALCAVNKDGKMIELVPLARLFAGNPYDELVPPLGEPS